MGLMSDFIEARCLTEMSSFLTGDVLQSWVTELGVFFIW